MIIVNEAAPGDKTYVVSVCGSNFCAHANNEDEAIEAVAEYFVSRGYTDYYFDALEIEIMADSVLKSVTKFIADADLYECRNHKIYLSKLTVKEV